MLSSRQEAIAGMAKEIASEIEKLLERSTRTCLNCQNFDNSDETCRLDPLRRRPPARVIAFGCTAFDEAPPF